MTRLRGLVCGVAAAGLLLIGSARSFAGPLAYAVNGVNGTDLVQVDLGTGAYVTIGSFTNSGIRSLALSPGGVLYGGSQVAFYSIDTATAATTLVGSPLAVLEDMDFSGNTLLASNTGIIYDINTTTGAETIIGSAITNVIGFAALSSTTAYVTYLDGIVPSLGLLNHSTTSITLIGALGAALGTGNAVYGLDVASDGNLYGLGTGGEVLRINTTTGEATLIAQTAANWRGLAAIPDDPNVPEPATMALSGLGLTLLAWLRKRSA